MAKTGPRSIAVAPTQTAPRGARPGSWLTTGFGELRHAARSLARDRGFSITALLTLALAIGAAVAVFSVYRSVILDPLPFPASERLVTIANSYPGAGVEEASNGVPDYYDRQREVAALAELALYRGQGMTLLHGETPERLFAVQATPSLFPLLRARTERGRLFTAEEGEVGSADRVLLSYDLWQRAFGGEEAVVGTSIRLDGTPRTVVGVLEPGFSVPPFDEETELFIPAAFTPEERSDDQRHSNSWQMLGRMADGASLELVQGQVDTLNQRNLERFPQFAHLLVAAGFHTKVNGFREELIADIAPKLTLLLVGALFVLLIGTVNVAELILVRTTTRRKDLATRSALGAGRWQITRQLVAENLLLALGGGALGLLAGYWGIALIASLGADSIPRGAEIAIDGGIVALAFTAAAAIGLVFGLIPAVQVFREDLSSFIREEGRAGSASRSAIAARNSLVVAQVTFACLLLIGAGLLLASFAEMLAVETGFRTEGVLTGTVSLPESRYPDGDARRAFFARLQDAVASLPGVAGVGMTDSIPFGDDESSSVITVEGYAAQPGESVRSPYRRVATPGFFESMEIAVLDGRVFDQRDTADSQQVVVVDRWLAEKYWPGRDPLGGRLFQGVPEMDDEPEWKTVIGVVDEIRYDALTGNLVEGAYYYPHSQVPTSRLTLAVAVASGDPEALSPALRDVLRRLDPELPLYDVETMTARIERSLVDTRLPMTLALVFAGVALFLAAVGIYGVLAYSVVQRTRELGIRVALGASARGVFRLVLSQGLAILAVGLAAGLGGGFLLSRAMRGLLYGVQPSDPRVFAMVAALLLAVALVASVLPARRATQVDPLVALAAD